MILADGNRDCRAPAQVVRVAEDVSGDRLTAPARLFVEEALAG
ncbi:MAG: hypothetical protein ACR2J6_06415 [Thermoleophilaceae bacterium]